MSTPDSNVLSTTRAAPALAPAANALAAPANAPSANSLAATGATAPDPLAQLRGLHLPDAVGAWPPAPGWWGAGALVLATIVVALVWRRARRASLAHHALRELDRLSRESTDLQGLAVATSALLRRVALRRFGQTRVASLHGADWQRFLCENGPSSPSGSRIRLRRRRAAFGDETGRLLALAPYTPPGSAAFALGGKTVERNGVVAAARDWIRWNS